MTNQQADVTAVILARGMVEAWDACAQEGSVLQQDSGMPMRLRRGLALLSGHCIAGGVPDLGASVHVASERACEPFSSWGVPAFAPPFRYADVVLVDRELGIPTSDCRELAALGGSEVSAQEEAHHEALRASVLALPLRRRDAAYTEIREFVVRNPAVAYAERERFVVSRSLVAAARTVASFYRPVPAAALFDGTARLCGNCSSLLWPDRDTDAYPDGRCRIRQCRLARPETRRGADITNSAEWQLATSAALGFWVGPGLDEIRIHDALKAAGLAAVLYPMGDAADVGVDGMEIGIDVKTYASADVLASKLTRSIGRLAQFRRRILAVPDDKLRLNPRYLQQLRDIYRGAHPLEFMTASQAITALA